MDSDDEQRRLLLETLKLTRENNEMLRKMRRSAMYRSILSFVWILIILILPLILYFSYLAPLVEQASAVYESIGNGNSEGFSLDGIKELLQ